MDPVVAAGIVALLLGGAGLLLVFRAVRQRGVAEAERDQAEEERDEEARKVAELSKPRARGRRLLDRLQKSRRR